MTFRLFPARLAWVLFVFLLIGSSSQAQDNQFPTGPEAGRELAAKLRAVKPEGNTNWHGVLEIFGRKHKIPPVPLDCEQTVADRNWTVTYTTHPTDTNLAEKFVIVFSLDKPNQYFYARAASPGQPPGEVKPISAAEADIPLGNSDFWLTDLGLEFLHWPEQFRLKGDIHNGRGRYVLVSTNPHPAPGGYSTVKTWIDKQSDEPTRAEAYGTNTNRVMKSFSLEKIAQVDGGYQAKELEINGEGKFWTRLTIDVNDRNQSK
jgi:Outer membrane lipoprotein-sorting protein